MAAYAGQTVMYKTAAGYVPAVTTAHRDNTGAIADVSYASATTVDIVTLGYQPTRVASVAKGAQTGFPAGAGTAAVNTTGTVWIPA